jgi:CDP-diacylglycerol--serine O-phosphatidyltransferase
VFLIVLAFVAIAGDPPKVLFGMFVLYGLSGYAIYFWRLAKGKPVSIVQTEIDHHDEH